MEVSGDKFAAGVRIVVDGRELTTRFISPQQLSATVPASMIANPGSRSVMVKSAGWASLFDHSVSQRQCAADTELQLRGNHWYASLH